METKRCKGCKLDLPLDKFGYDGRTNDKLNWRCWSCRSLAQPGDTEKRCLDCGELKSLDDFHRDLGAIDLRRKICKKCGTKAARKWNDENPRQHQRNIKRHYQKHKGDAKRAANRKSHLMRTYGITDDQYWELFEAQGRGCAICGFNPKQNIST